MTDRRKSEKKDRNQERGLTDPRPLRGGPARTGEPDGRKSCAYRPRSSHQQTHSHLIDCRWTVVVVSDEQTTSEQGATAMTESGRTSANRVSSDSDASATKTDGADGGAARPGKVHDGARVTYPALPPDGHPPCRPWPPTASDERPRRRRVTGLVTAAMLGGLVGGAGGFAAECRGLPGAGGLAATAMGAETSPAPAM
jgi:hypothetical protein